ncbi:hypothetical protein [Pedobacter sp. ASV28]|uniref:hypothetical protein n=1 Tax=Pedobacter sp. ASV28 TaxID=2795123 RepID=UPI001E30BE9E|nr:hypothetical protein [Pedobacter sp. ASV28]
MQKRVYIATCLLLSVIFFHGTTKAQTQLSANNLTILNKLQDTLVSISDSTYAIKDDVEKLAYNTLFVKRLIAALKTPYSFNFNFELLNNISILRAPNQSFKIITWTLPFNDGTYKFYGTIQLATKDGQLKLIPLNDDTANFADDNAITNHKKWYGARYYDIIPVTLGEKPPYYLLLGWKGNNDKTTKKVIEILSIDKGEAIFGRNIFEMPKTTALRNRMVFEYSKQNSMTLSFDKNVNLIVFDHLVPYQEEMAGNYEYYASDLSFDAYVINYNKLRLRENVELKNEPSNMDEFYSTPIKATTLYQKGKH